MPKDLNWLQVNKYHPLVERVKELNKSGVQITRSSNSKRKCALEIAAEEFDYGYWHAYQIYYFIYDEKLAKRLIAEGAQKKE